MRDPPLLLVRQVAEGLGGLCERVVFIGGAIAPLLHVDPPFPAPRPTGDVDAIAAATGYGDFDRMRKEMRRLGFRESMDARHAHRWITPGPLPVPFDLVPIGQHLGASGNPWDDAALRTATRTEIAPGLHVRHASGPGFLALKFAAFQDRGADDPLASADLEDIFALVAARPPIVVEARAAPDELRTFISGRAAALLALDAFEDLLAGHLGNVARSHAARVIPDAERRLRELASG